jgi:hypothetical protein
MSELEKRVAALEEAVRRLQIKNRGYLTQSAAAEYLGRSKEYLREHHAGGTGPQRLPNGQYSYQALDEWLLRQVKKPDAA